MHLSKFFLPLIKENPSEAQVISHRLMLKCGMIKQAAAGIYSWLPIGLKVLNNIQNIIKKNVDEIGCIELLMPCIQSASLWKESGRYDAYGPEMLRIQDRHQSELLFGPTNEELVTEIFRANIKSYKDLPMNLYHIQWKFRDEIRPRFGVMRGREFLMKDGYSFDISKEKAMQSYDAIFAAYCKIFRDMGLNVIPVKADSGPIGGDLSHEFHVLADTGESTIYYDKRFDDLMTNSTINPEELRGLYAAADEMHDERAVSSQNLEILQKKGIEVGHIFYFGTKYSEPMKARVSDNQGLPVPIHMGSYGIGVTRLVAAIIESSHDEAGIIWPESVAPFKVSIINLGSEDAQCIAASLQIYDSLKSYGLDILLDDTKQRPGIKFATHDLIGIPWHIIIGNKKIATGQVELKSRKTGLSEDVSLDIAIKRILEIYNVN